MKFSELPLFAAVSNVYRDIKAENESGLKTPSPRSEEWLLTRRSELTQRVILEMCESDTKILRAFLRYAKAPKNGSRIPKLHLTIQVADFRGNACFYAGRGKGECSEDVHLDRIITGSRGGEYSIQNCVLSCGRHNMMRGDKTVEEFLQS